MTRGLRLVWLQVGVFLSIRGWPLVPMLSPHIPGKGFLPGGSPRKHCSPCAASRPSSGWTGVVPVQRVHQGTRMVAMPPPCCCAMWPPVHKAPQTGRHLVENGTWPRKALLASIDCVYKMLPLGLRLYKEAAVMSGASRSNPLGLLVCLGCNHCWPCTLLFVLVVYGR